MTELLSISAKNKNFESGILISFQHFNVLHFIKLFFLVEIYMYIERRPI